MIKAGDKILCNTVAGTMKMFTVFYVKGNEVGITNGINYWFINIKRRY